MIKIKTYRQFTPTKDIILRFPKADLAKSQRLRYRLYNHEEDYQQKGMDSHCPRDSL